MLYKYIHEIFTDKLPTPSIFKRDKLFINKDLYIVTYCT